jgi:hypothetical protein
MVMLLERPGPGDVPSRLEATLTQVEQRDEPASTSNVSLEWRHDRTSAVGRSTDVWAADGLVFAPHLGDIIEILDGASGALLGEVDTGAARPEGGFKIVLDVKARDGILYAATVTKGLLIYEVGDPVRPSLAGTYFKFDEAGSPQNFFNIHNVFLAPTGDVIYAINTSYPGGDLRLIDVSVPAAPRDVGRFTPAVDGSGGSVHDVNVIEHDGRLVAFLNAQLGGLYILDVTEPAAIELARLDQVGGHAQPLRLAFPHGWAALLRAQ